MPPTAVARRQFLRGAAALGLLAVMPIGVKRKLTITDELSLRAPVPTPDPPGFGWVAGWSIAFDEVADYEARAPVALWRGASLLDRQIVRDNAQTFFVPEMRPYGDLTDFTLEVDRPGYAALYTSRGVEVLRVAG